MNCDVILVKIDVISGIVSCKTQSGLMATTLKFEQRCVIKFCVNAKMSLTDTYKFIQKGKGGSSASRSVVFAWHKKFRTGVEDIRDKPRSGRPSRSEDVIKGKGNHYGWQTAFCARNQRVDGLRYCYPPDTDRRYTLVRAHSTCTCIVQKGMVQRHF